MSLQIRPAFFMRALFRKFFSKILPESWGCGLYTSAAYTRVFTVNELYKKTHTIMCIICMDSEQHVNKTYLQLVAIMYVISFIFVHHGFFYVLIMIINYAFIIIIIINLTHIKLEPAHKQEPFWQCDSVSPQCNITIMQNYQTVQN